MTRQCDYEGISYDVESIFRNIPVKKQPSTF